jgi:hypothetical protein
MIRPPVLLLALFIALPAAAQSFDDASDEVFADDEVAIVRVTVDPLDLKAILAPENAQSDVEYLASFTFESPYVTATFDSVGLRLRGNTSRVSQKKSFRVSFNTFLQGGDFRGLEKLNLNGEHNDPSIVRAKLSWDLFGTVAVPASRAAHVRLYINEEYFGLYLNVEHVDERFLRRRFGNDDGFLYKCLWPADLTPVSEDACEVQLGADEFAAYAELRDLLVTVNNTSDAAFPGAIERAFDVNGFLRHLAVTVATGSWDSYWFLKNNFYLYLDAADDRFHFIPYDYDNTFGIWWDGIWSGLDWSTRDVYAWGHPVEPRPLATRILAVPEFRERYTLYLKRLLADGFDPQPLKDRALALRTLTATAAEEDTYRTLDSYGFTIEDWYDSYTVALADRNPTQQGHVKAGLLPFIDARHASAQTQLDAGNITPVLSEVRVSPLPARPVDPIEVTMRVEDEGIPEVEVEYWLSGPSGLVATAAPAPDLGRDFWRAVLPALGTTGVLDVRARARDTEGAVRTGPLIAVPVNLDRPLLFLNEFMALNATTVADEFGEFDDWVEVHNAGGADVSLTGLFLTDDPGNPDRWALPDVTVPAGGFALLWTDGTPEQGPLHGPFRLGGGGETVALVDADLTTLDEIAFGAQTEDVAFGRTVDGAGSWQALAIATPGASNAGATDRERDVPSGYAVEAWPNPFRDRLQISATAPSEARVLDLLGREIARLRIPASGRVEWDGLDAAGRPAPSGLYLLRIVGDAGYATRVAARTVPVVKVR